MVGRKTSQRCEICRKRKIKCDLAKPACSQCQKAGWPCPGYDSHAVFHQHMVRTSKKATTSLNVRQIPMSATEKLRSELVLKGNTGRLSARFVVIPEFRVMEHLPRRLGEDRALDDAVRLICTSDQEATIRAYGMALQSLHDSINRGLSPEALGAATLLQMHDFFRNASSLAWAVHAKGVIDMLKARGAEGVKTGFDKCLLQAQVGNITFDALRERRPCFLAQPEWNAKVKTLSKHDETAESEKLTWEMSLIAIGVRIPGLICRFEDGDPLMVDDLLCVRQELEQALGWAMRDNAEGGTLMGARGSTNRIRPALLLSANVYLIMIEYMIEAVSQGVFESRQRITEPKFALDTIRALYQQLVAIDATAAQSTASMQKLTLERVLNAADDTRTKTGAVSMVLNEVYKIMSLSPQQLYRLEMSGRATAEVATIPA